MNGAIFVQVASPEAGNARREWSPFWMTGLPVDRCTASPHLRKHVHRAVAASFLGASRLHAISSSRTFRTNVVLCCVFIRLIQRLELFVLLGGCLRTSHNNAALLLTCSRVGPDTRSCRKTLMRCIDIQGQPAKGVEPEVPAICCALDRKSLMQQLSVHVGRSRCDTGKSHHL